MASSVSVIYQPRLVIFFHFLFVSVGSWFVSALIFCRVSSVLFFSIFNKIRTINLKTKKSHSFHHVFVAEMMFTDEFTESENFRW